MIADTVTNPEEARAWDVVSSVMDPEIPAISVVDLGIINSVDVSNGGVAVSMTPTYVACIATHIMSDEIKVALEQAGFDNVSVTLKRAPAWTSDRMTPQGQARLAEYGIAPPAPRTSPNATPECPNCGSKATHLVSVFGSSACKSLHKCNDCGEPFERFKCK